MATDFNFPDVGEGIVEGKLVKWHVAEGQQVARDATLAEVETDKAIVEIPSPQDGKIEKLLYKEGDTMEVGKPMFSFADGKGPATAPARLGGQAERREEKPEAAAPVPGPPSLPSEKAQETKGKVLALPAVRHFAGQHGVDLSAVKGTGKDGRVEMEDLQEHVGSSAPSVPKMPHAPEVLPRTDILASPSLRRYARSQGADLSKIHGSGEHGHITKEDIDAFIRSPSSTVAAPAFLAPGKPDVARPSQALPKTAIKVTGPAEIIPISPIRHAILTKMMRSLQSAAQVTHSDEADVTDLVKVKDREKEALEKEGIHLTFLPFFVKAAVAALRKHPLLNSSLDETNQTIVLKKYYHIGIAVDTPDGLLLPVVKDADKKSIAEIAKEIGLLAAKARERKLSPKEMDDSTFSISSVGRFGGQVFTPILNYPEAALLGIGRIVDKPAVVGGKVMPRKMVTVSVTYDHRILDGGETARFVSTLISYLEDPDLLMVEIS